MSFQSDERILVATPAVYERPPAESRWLIASSRRQGIELTLLGTPGPYRNDRQKTELVADYLQHHPEYRYVLQVDFKDVIFCATLRELFDKYQAIGAAIVAAADRLAWPLTSHQHLSPAVATSYRHLNAGTIFASREAWLDAWATMQRKERAHEGIASERGCRGLDIFSCDQAAWSDLYVHGQADIAVDSRCDLFQPLSTTCPEVHPNNPELRLIGRRVVNIETGGRPCLVHVNADRPIDPWGRYVLDPEPKWNRPLIETIRQAPLDQLRSVAGLEALILELGLHHPVEECVPAALLPYTGCGLAIWQRPKELARYLVWLSQRPPIRSYLEIGVDEGGMFIATTEYLRRFHPLETSIALDIRIRPPVLDYARRTEGVYAVCGKSDSAALHELLGQVGPPDLIFIDGDHSAAGVRKDWSVASTIGRYIGFHDIAAGALPGVTSLWAELLAGDRLAIEFVNPDPNLVTWAGIGVIDLARCPPLTSVQTAVMEASV